jgi:DNA recombination protein RmuC
MDVVSIISIGVVILLLAFIAYKVTRKDGDNEQDKEALMLIRQQEERLERTRKELNELLRSQNELLNKQFADTNKSMQQNFQISQQSLQRQLRDSVSTIQGITKEVTSIRKTGEQVADLAKQMDSLEKILKNPKQRGVLGEYFLETTLKNVLPPESFQMQYKFKNGEIVDAVVFIKDKIVPVDSKFSLENYNRIVDTDDVAEKERLEKVFKNDLKFRIDEAAKYIRPDEGTMEFVFMFIPSEGIYYDLLVNKVGALKVNTRDLISYAFTEKNVIIVSPTSFLAYLQTVLQGLRMLKIEESAIQIRENVSKLAKHLKAYDDYFSKVGKHLGTTVNAYNSANKELGKIDKDVLKISGESMELNSEEVESI